MTLPNFPKRKWALFIPTPDSTLFEYSVKLITDTQNTAPVHIKGWTWTSLSAALSWLRQPAFLVCTFPLLANKICFSAYLYLHLTLKFLVVSQIRVRNPTTNDKPARNLEQETEAPGDITWPFSPLWLSLHLKVLVSFCLALFLPSISLCDGLNLLNPICLLSPATAGGGRYSHHCTYWIPFVLPCRKFIITGAFSHVVQCPEGLVPTVICPHTFYYASPPFHCDF